MYSQKIGRRNTNMERLSKFVGWTHSMLFTVFPCGLCLFLVVKNWYLRYTEGNENRDINSIKIISNWNDISKSTKCSNVSLYRSFLTVELYCRTSKLSSHKNGINWIDLSQTLNAQTLAVQIVSFLIRKRKAL